MDNKKTIGIVGGGQLGMMLTVAAHKLGFRVIVLDPTPESPAGKVADKQIIGNFKNMQDVLGLAEECDFITFEVESANQEALKELEEKGREVHPSPETLGIIKDKFKQKVFLRNKDILVADFALVENIHDCKEQALIFGYPFLLKTRFGAYDGRGNYVIHSEDDIQKALDKFTGQELYAEKFVPFAKELAVVSARDKYENIVSFPVVETVHKNNICHIVKSPAQVGDKEKEKAKDLAQKVLEALSGVGVIAVEMFLTKEGEVLVNEIAPRVHNSGHHTIEAYNVSQFEQHIRAITGMEILPINSLHGSSIMINILGEHEGLAVPLGVENFKDLDNINIHIYGKINTRIERKMGHITVTGEDIEKVEKIAINTRGKISI